MTKNVLKLNQAKKIYKNQAQDWLKGDFLQLGPAKSCKVQLKKL